DAHVRKKLRVESFCCRERLERQRLGGATAVLLSATIEQDRSRRGRTEQRGQRRHDLLKISARIEPVQCGIQIERSYAIPARVAMPAAVVCAHAQRRMRVIVQPAFCCALSGGSFYEVRD